MLGVRGGILLALTCIAPVRQIQCKHKDYGIWNFTIQKKKKIKGIFSIAESPQIKRTAVAQICQFDPQNQIFPKIWLKRYFFAMNLA